ncbi:MAG TPA: site-specific integrase, partial [bacterium]|nr:site-specific integrase [bacterium]
AGRIAPRTVNHSLVLLKQMLEAAVDWGYLPHNPARRVRKLKIGRMDPQIWTIGEIRRFALNASDAWRPLFLVALFAGLRLGEIQALAWDRQNRPMFATRKIEVRSAYNERTGVLGRPKSDNSMRAVDMVPTVHHALSALSAGTASGLIFPGPGGKPLPAWMLYDHGFRPAIKRAGVNRIRFHDLRHTYASLLVMAGKHPKYIADQMGHASAAFTLDTYGHLMGRLPVQPVEWIDDLVFPEGLEAALNLHMFGAPNGAIQGHAVPRGEEGDPDRDRARTQAK